jgi:hypothetical protein
MGLTSPAALPVVAGWRSLTSGVKMTDQETRKKPMPALEKELEAFEREKPRLLKEHRGKFALFKGDEFVDSFSTFELAYHEGIKRFGLEPFMIKEIRETDPVVRFPALALGLIARADL